eukprot:784829-Amphidinium_carterae.5
MKVLSLSWLAMVLRGLWLPIDPRHGPRIVGQALQRVWRQLDFLQLVIHCSSPHMSGAAVEDVEEAAGSLNMGAIEMSVLEPSGHEYAQVHDHVAVDKPEHMKSAQEHSQDVKQALMWLATDHFAFAMGMRLVMEPLRLLLHQQFHAASELFEFEQRVLVAEMLLRGSEATDMQGCRHWMITLAAQGVHEGKAIDKLEELFDHPDLWKHFPSPALNVHFRSTMFQLLSRIGACLQYYFVCPHTTYPVKLFRLLHEPQLWQDIQLEKACLLDAWSANLIEQCKHADVSLIQHILQTHAQQLSTNISVTETLHASIRRAVTLSSTQTWVGDFAYVSALWVCQTLRNGAASRLVRSRCFPKAAPRERKRKVPCGAKEKRVIFL